MLRFVIFYRRTSAQHPHIIETKHTIGGSLTQVRKKRAKFASGRRAERAAATNHARGRLQYIVNITAYGAMASNEKTVLPGGDSETAVKSSERSSECWEGITEHTSCKRLAGHPRHVWGVVNIDDTYDKYSLQVRLTHYLVPVKRRAAR